MKTASPILCLLVVILAACGTTFPQSPAEPVAGKATVLGVVDGDSLLLDVDGERVEVRLDGINAPELGECFHAQASSHLASLVEGRLVDLTVTGTDQFDRSLADVHLDGIHVNAEMVAQGMAIATTPGSSQPPTLVEAEEVAAAGGLGLWSPRACGQGPLPAVDIDFDGSVVDPPGPDEDFLDLETIALVNRSNREVDLGGWVLRDESSRHRFHFHSGSSIGPGETLVVSSGDPGWSPGGSPVWNNQGDLILLLDESGRVVARLRY